MTQLSKSRVSAMAEHLDEQVTAFRNRSLDAGPYSFVRADALIRKVREGGRIVNVHALIAVGVDTGGHREILGLDAATAEDGAGRLAFLRSLIARGLSGVQLVISDAHAGLVDAIGTVLPGSSWQRCRTHLRQKPAEPGPQVGPALGGDPFAPGAPLIIDFGCVSYCDSTGVTVLVTAYHRAEAAGCPLSLTGLGD